MDNIFRFLGNGIILQYHTKALPKTLEKAGFAFGRGNLIQRTFMVQKEMLPVPFYIAPDHRVKWVEAVLAMDQEKQRLNKKLVARRFRREKLMRIPKDIKRIYGIIVLSKTL